MHAPMLTGFLTADNSRKPCSVTCDRPWAPEARPERRESRGRAGYRAHPTWRWIGRRGRVDGAGQKEDEEAVGSRRRHSNRSARYTGVRRASLQANPPRRGETPPWTTATTTT